MKQCKHLFGRQCSDCHIQKYLGVLVNDHRGSQSKAGLKRANLVQPSVSSSSVYTLCNQALVAVFIIGSEQVRYSHSVNALLASLALNSERECNSCVLVHFRIDFLFISYGIEML